MRKAIALVAGLMIVAAAASIAAFGHEGRHSAKAANATVLPNLWYELVGQFENSAAGVTPETHIHYGYISWIQGVSGYGGTKTLRSATLTFFADGKTSPVTANGPLRMITRVGKLTIYRDSSRNSDWAHPNTFRDGTPVLVAQYRHQPITSTLTNAVSLLSRDTITFARPFASGNGNVQLGKVGDRFEEHYVGQGNMPGPPSGYFIGYAVSR